MFKRKKSEKIVSDTPLVSYECKPFEQLPGCLEYAFFEKKYEEDFLVTAIKEYKEGFLVVNLLKNLDNVEKVAVINQNAPTINLYCIRENTELTRQFARENSSAKKDLYQMVLIYNEEKLCFEEYVKLPKNKMLKDMYYDLLFKFLDMVDPLEEKDD